MRPATFIVAALLLACVALPGRADDGGWVTVAPEGLGFTALFPAAPALTEKSSTTSHSYIWVAKTPDETVTVLAGVTDYTVRIDAKKELALDEKNFLSATGASSTLDKTHEFPGPGKKSLPALTFHFKREGDSGKSMVVVDRDTAYQVVVLVKDGHDGSVESDRFFDAFKLIPRKKPAPAPAAAPAPKP